MPDTPQETGRLTTTQAVLQVEQLLALFDAQDPRFGSAFYAADRDVLGAALAFASLAIREAAARREVSLDVMRRALRNQVSQSQAAYEQMGINHGQ